jgi:hypothetical protein
MAPNTAIVFVLCGTALLLLDRRRRPLRAQPDAVLLAALISFASLTGYIYGIPPSTA